MRFTSTTFPLHLLLLLLLLSIVQFATAETGGRRCVLALYAAGCNNHGDCTYTEHRCQCWGPASGHHNGYTCGKCEQECIGEWPYCYGNECPPLPVEEIEGGTNCDLCRYDKGGSCRGGECVCYDGWGCPDCSTNIKDLEKGERCPKREYPLVNDEPVVSTTPSPSPNSASQTGQEGSTVQQGGGRCKTGGDCFDYTGGACPDGKCVCYDGWTCSHCSLTQKEVDNGMLCPPDAANVLTLTYLALFSACVAWILPGLVIG